jgi:hypothetical protein
MRTRMSVRLAAIAVALGLLIGVAGPALASSGGCYVTANVSSDGRWASYNWYMYHDPWAGDGYAASVDVFDNVRNGIGVGVSNSSGVIYSWAHIAPGDTSRHNISGDWSTGRIAVHPAAMMWGSGCGFVAPWDSCDVHWQGDYWGVGWQKTW